METADLGVKPDGFKSLTLPGGLFWESPQARSAAGWLAGVRGSLGRGAEVQGTGSARVRRQLAQESRQAGPQGGQVVLARPWNEIVLGARKCFGQRTTNGRLKALQQAGDTALNPNIPQRAHVKLWFLNKNKTVEPTNRNFVLYRLFTKGLLQI